MESTPPIQLHFENAHHVLTADAAALARLQKEHAAKKKQEEERGVPAPVQSDAEKPVPKE